MDLQEQSVDEDLQSIGLNIDDTTQQRVELIHWDRLPSFSENPYWLNSAPCQLNIPEDDIYFIEDVDIYTADRIDCVKILSRTSANPFRAVFFSLSTRQTAMPFILSPGTQLFFFILDLINREMVNAIETNF